MQIITFASIAILARLLTPAEIGVYAVAASVAFLAIEMRALGAGQYLIREAEIDNHKIRSATGLMIVISWSMAAIIAISAPYIADFYKEQALVIIFWVIASSFLFAPFSTVPSAILTRNMRFQTLFIIRFTSSIVRSGSTIGFVLLGYSYYGLAMGVLAGAITEVILNSYYRDPGIPWLPSFSKFKDLFRFGAYTSTATTLEQFSLSIPDLVLGRLATMTDVGLFSRGLGIVAFLNKIIVQAVAPVILPHLSEVKRKGGSVSEAYLHAMVLQTSFSWPVFAIVNLSAFSMIRALFGNQWDAAIPIASILAIWAMLEATHSLSSHALISMQREKLMLKKEAIIFSIRLVGVILATPYGMLMVAWSMVLTGVISLLINTQILKMSVGIGFRAQFSALLPSALVAILCWVGLKLISGFIDFTVLNSWLSLAIIGVCMAVIWLTGLRLTHHALWQYVQPFFSRFIPGDSPKS